MRWWNGSPVIRSGPHHGDAAFIAFEQDLSNAWPRSPDISPTQVSVAEHAPLPTRGRRTGRGRGDSFPPVARVSDDMLQASHGVPAPILTARPDPWRVPDRPTTCRKQSSSPTGTMHPRGMIVERSDPISASPRKPPGGHPPLGFPEKKISPRQGGGATNTVMEVLAAGTRFGVIPLCWRPGKANRPCDVGLPGRKRCMEVSNTGHRDGQRYQCCNTRDWRPRAIQGPCRHVRCAKHAEILHAESLETAPEFPQ